MKVKKNKTSKPEASLSIEIDLSGIPRDQWPAVIEQTLRIAMEKPSEEETKEQKAAVDLWKLDVAEKRVRYQIKDAAAVSKMGKILGAGLGLGSLGIFSTAAAITADVLCFGGFMTAASVGVGLSGLSAGADRKKKEKELVEIQQRRMELQEKIQMQDSPPTAPSMPAMLKLLGPAVEFNDKPKQEKNKTGPKPPLGPAFD